MASVRTRSFSHPLPGDWIMSNLQRIGRDAAAPIQICLASTTLTAMLARRGQLEVVVMPPAAWSAREIEQAQATLAALAQISTPSAAHFLKSAMARDGGLGHVWVGAARPGMFAAYAAWSAREIELQALATLAALAQILHTVCRSFPKISSALSAKVCGGSRSAKSLIRDRR